MDTQRRIKELAKVVRPPGGYARPEGDDIGRGQSSPNHLSFASKQAIAHILKGL